MTDTKKLEKPSLIELIRNDPLLKETNTTGSTSDLGFIHLETAREPNNDVYTGSNAPSIQLTEFCYIMDQLVDREAYHIASRADIPALVYIICKYILKDERKGTMNRVHNYAVYMRRMIGWMMLA